METTSLLNLLVPAFISARVGYCMLALIHLGFMNISGLDGFVGA